MSMRLGIREKLFIMIAFIIGIIFIVQVFFQAFLLEGFYIERLASDMETSLNSVETALQDIPLDDVNQVRPVMEKMRLTFDTPLHIASSKDMGYTYNATSYGESFLALKLIDGSEAVINVFDDEVMDLIKLNPTDTSSKLKVSGYYSPSYEEIIPLQISVGDATYSYEDQGDIVNIFTGVVGSDSLIVQPLTDLTESHPIESYIDTQDDDWKYVETEGSLMYYQIGAALSDEYNYNDDVLLQQISDLSYSGALSRAKSSGFIRLETFDDYTNKNSLILYKKLDASPSDESYYVFSIISYAAIEEPLSIYQEYNWITILVGSVLAFILVYFFTGKMVQPIRDMERVTSKMAKLDFDERIQVRSSDEIGQLAQSFNTLSHELEDSIYEMQTLNTELEKEVIERTKQQEILKEFIGNASHELKTPITVMKGLIDGVEDGVYDATSKDHKASVKDEVHRMEKIVYDLLQVSKMERGAQHVVKTIFDPSDLIYSTYQRHKAHGIQKEMTFHFDFEDTFVRADIDLIESVIDNLISNAIKYSDPGAEVFLSIQARQDHTQIRIENTLAHIPEEDLTNIFEPFFRVDKSHTRKTGGSGLGMSIVKNILDLHQAAYSLENTDKGVAFLFSLDRVLTE